MKMIRKHCYCFFLVVALLALAVGDVWGQTTPATSVSILPSPLDRINAPWDKGEYTTALAQFQETARQNPNNIALHTGFVEHATASPLAGEAAAPLI
jgi:hypothetical protein